MPNHFGIAGKLDIPNFAPQHATEKFGNIYISTFIRKELVQEKVGIWGKLHKHLSQYCHQITKKKMASFRGLRGKLEILTWFVLLRD